MKKKWIILICALVVVLVTAVTLSFTLFTVQTIEVDYNSSTTQEYDNQKIIESSKITKGKNIFFLKKSAFANNIENAFPYLKVLNIETKFPSKLVIHLQERTSLYAIKSGEEYLIIDADQKVLEKTSDLSEINSALVLLEAEAEANECEFLNLPFLTELYDAFLLNQKTLADEISMITTISYFESENEVYHNLEKGLTITLKTGRKVFLHNASYALAYKLAKFFAVEESLPQLSAYLTDEQIAQSEIHINNFIGSEYGEADSYFYLVYNGERLTLPDGAL